MEGRADGLSQRFGAGRSQHHADRAGHIVGAGAVVVKDVPDFSIVAGVPAKVIGDVRNKK